MYTVYSMQNVPIKRESLRDQVRESLRRQIVEGALAPGEALKELELSESLGVSRTPLREALIQLEQDGMVRAGKSRGFSVAPLTVDEVEELFPIVGSLHGLALREAGAEIVVALCHGGIDPAAPEHGAENPALRIAALEGVDAVLCGHQHMRLPGPDFDGVPGVDEVPVFIGREGGGSLQARSSGVDVVFPGYYASGGSAGGGIDGYDLDTLRADYRVGVLYGWVIPVFAVGTLDFTSERAVALWTEVVRRSQAAMLDHRVADLLVD